MGSSGKKRTTMAKLNRESKLRDKRADKEARKTARRLRAESEQSGPGPDAATLNGEQLEAVAPPIERLIPGI